MYFDEIAALDKQYVMQSYGRFPVAIHHGTGATLYDTEGKKYIDFAAGIGVLSIGSCHPKWIAAIEEQIRKLGHISNLFYSEPGTLLGEKLCRAAGMSNVFFANSGGEANEGAIKLARKYSFDKYGKGRATILTLVNSFHGRTITTLSATGQEKFHQYFFPFTEGFRHVPANDLEALKAAADESVCAVMAEGVQGEGGILPLDGDYLHALRSLCDERDWLLMFDEVQAGMGRTGHMFCYQSYGVSPDVAVTAKGIAGGLPLAAVLAGERCREVFTPGTHATTFGANPVCCAAALTVLDVIEEVLPQVEQKGRYLRDRIEAMHSPFIKGTRGMGLMIGVPLQGVSPAELSRKLVESGLLCITAGSDAVRLLPPLTITYEEMDEGLAILQSVLQSLAR